MPAGGRISFLYLSLGAAIPEVALITGRQPDGQMPSPLDFLEKRLAIVRREWYNDRDLT